MYISSSLPKEESSAGRAATAAIILALKTSNMRREYLNISLLSNKVQTFLLSSYILYDFLLLLFSFSAQKQSYFSIYS